MALLFLDSFDHYATADLLEKWTTTPSVFGNNTSIHATAGRRSSGALQVQFFGSPGAGAAVKTLAPTGATAIVGMSVASNALTGGTAITLCQVLSGGTVQVSLVADTAASVLKVYRGGYTAGTLLGTSSAFALGTVAYLELQVLLSTTVGTVTVRVNGVAVLTLTGLNTAATGVATWTSVALGQATGETAAACILTFDDLYVLDGSGSAPQNTFLGDVRVDARYPTAEGASAAWTPSSGTDNALLVDETAPNDDTDYTSAGTVGQTDTFVVQDAPVPGAVLYGVQHCLAMKKSDAGTCLVAPVVRHSSTDYVGSDLAPGTTYAYGLAVQATNPGTAAQWTEADFNAAEFGYTRTA